MADATTSERAVNSSVELLDELKAEMGGEGFQHLLDPIHSVTYLARGPKLIVTFERVADTLETSETGLPLAVDFAEDKNWSALHFAADGDTWFRSEAVYAFLDELVDDAFFEDFDQVVFYGANMGGYAAAAFSVVAPGARVVAICPQATLAHDLAEWDHRFPASRRLDFSKRYGYAPHMLDAARQAYVLYDPHEVLDAVHASLFCSDNIVRLKCRFFGHRIAPMLRDMDLLHRIIEEASEGRLTPQSFYAQLRKRRRNGPYLRRVLLRLDDRHRPYLTLLLCAHVLARTKAPAFQKRVPAARAALAKHGPLPDWAPD